MIFMATKPTVARDGCSSTLTVRPTFSIDLPIICRMAVHGRAENRSPIGRNRPSPLAHGFS